MKKYVMVLLGLGIFLSCSKNSTDDTQQPPPPLVDKTGNLLQTGASANDILANDDFENILIQIGHVEGFRPTQAAINNFTAYLAERTFKQDIQVSYLELPSPNQSSLSLKEIADLEEDNRTAYNDGHTIAIYIYFTDAPSEDDDEEQGLVTLGAVYRNTSMVIHESRVRQLANSSSLITIADIETATLNHEFGHLFGLVNLGTPAVNDHEDADAQNHCNVDGCLMRAELQFSDSTKKMLEKRASKGLAAPELDAECILDLQANGGK